MSLSQWPRFAVHVLHVLHFFHMHVLEYRDRGQNNWVAFGCISLRTKTSIYVTGYEGFVKHRFFGQYALCRAYCVDVYATILIVWFRVLLFEPNLQKVVLDASKVPACALLTLHQLGVFRYTCTFKAICLTAVNANVNANVTADQKQIWLYKVSSVLIYLLLQAVSDNWLCFFIALRHKSLFGVKHACNQNVFIVVTSPRMLLFFEYQAPQVKLILLKFNESSGPAAGIVVNFW